MLSKLILHSPVSFNYAKFLNFHINGGKYFQYHNSYLIPFQCKDINCDERLIIGNFVYPLRNTLEKLILYKGVHLNYTYMLGDKFTVENRPATLRCYNILHENMNKEYEQQMMYKKVSVYPNNVYIFDTFLKPDTILLFPVHKDITDILEQTKNF